MIKTLKHSLFAVALVVGFSMTATAQKEGDKKTPPKEKPPVIVVNPEKKPKEDKPKDDKKPGAMIFGNREETSFS